MSDFTLHKRQQPTLAIRARIRPLSPGVGKAVEKFYLDLETILQSLHLSGTLHGEIPAKKLGNRAPWQAWLRLVEGQVAACQILDNLGAVVNAGEFALEAIAKLGPLNWEVIPEALEGTLKLPRISQSGPLPPATETALQTPPVLPLIIPQRLLNVTLKQMNQTEWPRNYRMIYLLVDGIRTSEKIASMLLIPQPEVEQILHELQEMRIIDIKP